MSRGFWKKFLVDAGIPIGAAESYTSAFVENRITESMVSDLNKSVLIDLGITIIGDVISILKHAIHLTETSSAEKLSRRKSESRKKKHKRSGSEEKRPVKARSESESDKKVGEADKKMEQPKTERRPKKIIKVSEPETKPVPRPVIKTVVKQVTPVVKQESKMVKIIKKTKPITTTTAAPIPLKLKPKIVHDLTSKPKPEPKKKVVKFVVQKLKPKPAEPKQPVLVKRRLEEREESEEYFEEDDDEEEEDIMYYEEHEDEDEEEEFEETTRRVFAGNPQKKSRSYQVHQVPVKQSSPLFVRKISTQEKTGPIIKRVVTDDHISRSEPRIITRTVQGGSDHHLQGASHHLLASRQVSRDIQTVRCMSPDSTTDDHLPAPRLSHQKTTIILNTKGKCSVRAVSPPADLKTDQRRKILPRSDGKSALTRVVQRHLDTGSPNDTPKRSKPKLESLKSGHYNSFRSDAEGKELNSVNKFRSEDDSFDVIPENRIPTRKTVRTRSNSTGRDARNAKRSISSRLGSETRHSFPSRIGGLAARVFSENRLAPAKSNRNNALRSVKSNRNNALRSDRKQANVLRSNTSKESSVFSRLGN